MQTKHMRMPVASHAPTSFSGGKDVQCLQVEGSTNLDACMVGHAGALAAVSRPQSRTLREASFLPEQASTTFERNASTALELSRVLQAGRKSQS